MSKNVLVGGFLSVSVLVATLAPSASAFWPFDKLFSKGEVKAEVTSSTSMVRNTIGSELPRVACDKTEVEKLSSLRDKYAKSKVIGSAEITAAMNKVLKQCEEVVKADKALQAVMQRVTQKRPSDIKMEVINGPTSRPDTKTSPSVAMIPKNCTSWFDGCNTCSVKEGVISGCTRMACKSVTKPPKCLKTVDSDTATPSTVPTSEYQETEGGFFKRFFGEQ